MMKCSLLFLGLLMPLFSLAQQSSSVSLPARDSLEKWCQNQSVPAIALASIEKGVIREIKVVGEKLPENPADVHTGFDVASIAKSITTLLTLKLVANGDWDLDAPLAEWWTDPDVATDPRHKILTSRHVLSHQTGFKNWRWMEEDKKLAFHFDPGTQFGYSGEGFEYLRRALEAKFDLAFEELADSLVFSPWSMSNSHFAWPINGDTSNIAAPHEEIGKPYPIGTMVPNAANDLLTTASDLASFGAKVMEGAGLPEELFEAMRTPQVEAKPGVQFGLGWIVFEDLPGGEYALMNAGSDPGVNAIILLLPKSGRGLVALTNGVNGRAMVMQMIGRTLDVGPAILERF